MTGASGAWDQAWAPVLYYFSAWRLRALVNSAIPASGGPAPLLPGETPAQTWAWLEREWENLDDQPPWAGTGLSRSVSSNRSDRATAMYWNLAAEHVHKALESELGGLARGTRVEVVDGVYSGLFGNVDHAGLDGVDDGPLGGPVRITGYSIKLDGTDGWAQVIREEINTAIMN